MVTTNNNNIFLSYRRDSGRHLAGRIHEHLSNRGYDVFLDVQNINSGEFDKIILRQIEQRTHFIILLTDGALERCVNADDWVRREIETAMRLERNIVPIIDKDFKFDKELQYLPASWRVQFSKYNGIRLTHDYFDAAMAKLRTRFLKEPEYIIDTKPKQRGCPTAPSPPKHFTGREKELKNVHQHLLNHDVSAITAIHAMGGMGKTSLAQAICHLKNTPFTAVLWAEITQNPLPRSHLETWGRYAEADYSPPPDMPLEQIADYVRTQLTQYLDTTCGKPMLVVFDDVWENGHDTVKLLQRAMPPDAKVLITTRHAAVAHGLQATALEIDTLPDVDAKVLLHRLRTNRFVTDDHLKRAVQIIKGHPLALELAAATLNQAEDSEDAGDILDDYAKGLQDGIPFDEMDLGSYKSRSLQIVFEKSYQRLSPDSQRFFRGLGVIATDSAWERPIAGAIWDIQDKRTLTKIHKELRIAAFIRQDDELSDKRNKVWYRQHLLLRAFARTLLDQTGETETVFRRYLSHVITAATKLEKYPPEKWYLLAPYLLHIHAVGDELVSHFENSFVGWADLALAFAIKTYDYLAKRPEVLLTRQNEGDIDRIAWLEMGLNASIHLANRSREGFFLGEMGVVYAHRGDSDNALKHYKKSLAIHQELKDIEEQASAFSNIGHIFSDRKEHEKALKYYQEALACNRKVKDYASEAVTRNNIGRVYYKEKEYDTALKFYKQAVKLHKKAKDMSGQASTMNNIGAVYVNQGDMEKGLEFFREALKLNKRVGDKMSEASTLNNMGYIYYKSEQFEKVLEIQDEVISISQSLGNIRSEALYLYNKGMTLSKSGRILDAISYIEQAIQLLSVKLPDDVVASDSINKYKEKLTEFTTTMSESN